MFAIVTWPKEHRQGGILFSEWDLWRTSAHAAATPGQQPAPYQVASLAVEPALIEVPAAPAEDDRETTGTGAAPVKPAAPQVAIEDVCVAMAAAAQTSDLPVGYFARLIYQESKFSQWVVSRAGAMGVAQFMPRTAAWIGLDDPFDPIAALPASARFLRMLEEQFGNLGLAAAAYNAGPGRIQDWLAGRGRLPEETRNYVRIVTGHEVEKWTARREIDVSFHLPAKAPCEGIAGLSRDVTPIRHVVAVEPAIGRLIETARAEAAKRAAKVALQAQKRSNRQFAKKKGGQNKVAANGTRSKQQADKKPRRPVKLATN